MNFGVLLTKKNFDYLRPNQIKDREKSAENSRKSGRIRTAISKA